MPRNIYDHSPRPEGEQARSAAVKPPSTHMDSVIKRLDVEYCNHLAGLRKVVQSLHARKKHKKMKP